MLAFAVGSSFCFALGTDALNVSIAGLGASIFDQYRGRYSREMSPWLLLFLTGIFAHVPLVSALSAGPVAVLMVRLFQDGMTIMGFRCSLPRIAGEKWTALVLAGGWSVLGMISQVDALFVLVGKKSFIIDPADMLHPFATLLPPGLMLLLPVRRNQESTPTHSDRLDFCELSKAWLNDASDDESSTSQTFRKQEPLENKRFPDIDFHPTGPCATKLKTFWNECIKPNLDVFEEFDLTGTIRKIMIILDLHGGIPSVRRQDKKDRLREPDQYEALSRISLAVHTIHVAKNVIESINERFPENISQHLPCLFVAALAHDLGKLEIVSGKRYVTGQHPVDGANFLQDEVMKGHPWCEKVAEFVRRHHEAIVDRTPVDLAILIRADRKAREMELGQKIHLAEEQDVPEKKAMGTTEPRTDYGDRQAFPPRVEEIPSSFPVEKIFERLKDVTNVMLPNRSWVAFSQPDGVVYVQAETLHETISRIAQEEGFEDAFFHATDRDTKKSCLQSFYEEFRKRGWVPENLVGAGFYGNFFWVWNPVSRKKIRTFYVPVKAEAFRMEPADLEAQRKAHAILASVKIIGIAAPERK